ncbi:MAG: ABC transporter substrate-binding protein/permease [Lactobacillus sp.]|jgi:polar amino acid transport system substrate-binding protein|uniref:ABC transporter substrate-binding protein/permease n=1 Tax=Lacticaseibacillus suilingensis TaxID=2799577 RepID=A0ABW4BGQ3_9LACO|nr:ABC transporter substrate-binding protein/permease [Lacticaseibacillus suilingensis]MCI1894284.1 ABC transporter substrate-binding protein/permease [Lactobacillus sp.]MCI1916871.1 ABC transporter substrate-binding protein/permease [Lactobacillus sp.]MCI1942075.1 ABC transporter substrate-binding protein/permease [Lactobacillus sp.]MCI1972462.1 ABC transporter substrate-binding protein/permease [Lactobacillus sp.]MCI2017265.1 ABC transporter substrate-binding protein/permease [Lactobacillus 
MHKFYRWVLSLIAILFIGGGLISTSTQTVQAATNDSTPAAIKKRGYIILGVSADYAPMEFHATVDGNDKIVGADISLAKKIAKDMGVKLQIKEMGFDALIGALKTGKVDMVISGMSDTPERRKQVDFSKPYTYEKQIMVIQKKDASKYKNIADFEGVKVGAQKQSTQEQIAKAELPDAKIVSLEKANDVIAQVQYGKINAGVMSNVVAGAYVQKNQALKIIDPKFATGKAPTVVAIAKGNSGLTSAVNKSIKDMQKQGLWSKYMDEAYTLQNQSNSFWQKYGSFFIKGAVNTLVFALLTVIAGTVLGTLLALMRRSKVWILKAIAVIYVEFIRGTPLMVQAFIVFFGTQVLGLNLSAFVAGAIAMGINSGAYVAEIIRSGLNSVPIGQTEAARSLGLSGTETTRFVVLPQAIKNIWPALGNEFVTDIKESSVLSVIGATELMFEGTTVQGASFEPFFPMMIVALIYFAMTFILSRLLGVVERRMN